MTIPRQRLPVVLAVAALLFAAAHLALEHMSGGVQTHHLLDRPDLPAISNWFGALILPVLGWLLGARIRRHLAAPTPPGSIRRIGIGFGCALLYGAALATSFEFDASAVSSGLFFGLFVLAAVLPVHRVESVLGFVVAMTFTFGAVLPTLIASVVAAVSFLLRLVFRALVSAVRRSVQRPKAA